MLAGIIILHDLIYLSFDKFSIDWSFKYSFFSLNMILDLSFKMFSSSSGINKSSNKENR